MLRNYVGLPSVIQCILAFWIILNTSKRFKETCRLQDFHFTHEVVMERTKTDDPPTKKRRTANSKKVGCLAFMYVKCVKVFVEERYKLNGPNLRVCPEKRRIMKLLNEDLLSATPPTGVRRYFIVISAEEEHNHTIVSSNLNQKLHTQLKKEIHSFVKNNPCSVKTMKIHLKEVVQTMFEGSTCPTPDHSNRCYYPSDNIIRFHMHQALFKIKKISYDQEALEENIKTWMAEYPKDTFFFRPYEVPSEDSVDTDIVEELPRSTMLFCHQTEWQRDLLNRYGNNISLLDATYKMCNYSLPLFFLVVKTNSGYCVVGTFVVQRESPVLIAEALSQFKQWNPDWVPKYFLSDFSKTELNAVEQTFPDSIVYLCAFHREQSWNRWLSKHGNVKKKSVGPLMMVWQNIAASHTQEEYQLHLKQMYESDDYSKNERAQTYFFQEWLPIHHRWVEAFQTKDFLSKVNTNNGVEFQNNVLKHVYLSQQTEDKTLTGVLRVILEDFLPDTLKIYSSYNAQINPRDKKYYDSLPMFLRNRPIAFVEKVMSSYDKGREYDTTKIIYLGDGVFMVRNEISMDNFDTVDFHQATCSCSDFCKWQWPCEHMCAVFACTDWGFDRLPLQYQENPYITVDLKYSAGISSTVPPVCSGSLADVNDGQCSSDTDYHHEETIEGNELDHIDCGAENGSITTEVDLKKTVEEIRDNLEKIISRTYLIQNTNNAVKLLKSVKQLNKNMELYTRSSIRVVKMHSKV